MGRLFASLPEDAVVSALDVDNTYNVPLVFRAEGADPPFEVAVSATTPSDDPAQAAETVAAYGRAGLTWWHEIVSPMLGSAAAMRERILAGPPIVDP